MPLPKMPRTFTSLNHPEPDEDGVQRYSLFEIVPDNSPDAPFPTKHIKRADNLTAEQVDAYIAGKGNFDA